MSPEDMRFEALWNENKERIVSLAGSMIKNREQRQDILQNARIQAWKSIHLYEGSRPFINWFCRILVNKLKDDIRYRSRRVASVSYNEALPDVDGTMEGVFFDLSPSVEDDLASISAAETFLAAIDRRDRKLLELVAENLPSKEIAKVFGIPTGTVRSRVSRMRGRLSELPATQELVHGGAN